MRYHNERCYKDILQEHTTIRYYMEMPQLDATMGSNEVATGS